MRTVIYHRNCNDGFCAAWVAWFKFRDEHTRYVPLNYGDEPPLIMSRDVFVLDFSFPREKLISMNEQAKSLVVLDHHKTAQADLDAVFVKAVQEVLSGLEKVLLSRESLQAALVSGGVPCTITELKERFESCVANLVKGKDPTKVRVVLE